MEIPKGDTARGGKTLIGGSIVIKGELSCGEDLYRRPSGRHHRPERKPPDYRTERSR